MVTTEPVNKRIVALSRPPEDPPLPEPKIDEVEIEDDIELDKDHKPLTLSDIKDLFMDGNGEGVRTVMKTFSTPEFDSEMIFEIEDLDVKPRALTQPSPNYLSALKRAKIEGAVKVKFIVTESGNVRSITIVNADHREFAESVRNALRRASFEPGKVNDQAVATRVRQTFNFNLK
jgi:TonB family protein